MQPDLHRCPTCLVVLLVFLLACSQAFGQIEPRAVILSAEIGPSIYIGEFNSMESSLSFSSFNPIPGYDFSVGLRYNVNEYFTIGTSLGFSGLSYQVNDSLRNKYSSNFFGAIGDANYPASNVAFTPTNNISFIRYAMFGTFNILPYTTWVPYVHGGLGLIAFEATNDSGIALPENMTGDFSRSAIVIPIGVGVNRRLTDRLAAFAQITYTINTTDYADGYAHYISYESNPGVPGKGAGATPDDYFVSLSFGLALTIYVTPDPPMPPEASTQPNPRSNPESPSDTALTDDSWNASASAQPPPPVPSGISDSAVSQRDSSAQNPPNALDTASPPRTAPTTPQAAQPLRPTPDDRDGDGLSDRDETGRFLTNPVAPDTDNDNLRDPDEIFRYNTSPNNPDTDSDGLFDGQEVHVYKTNPLIRDTDHDGLSDSEEVLQYGSDPTRPDSDGDGLFDGIEVRQSGSNPLLRDTDNDTIPDNIDACPSRFGPVGNRGCPE